MMMDKPEHAMPERTYNHCPECGFSAMPNEILSHERKHHWPHSLECTRCGYRTETKNTWEAARSAWNAPRPDRRRDMTEPKAQYIGFGEAAYWDERTRLANRKRTEAGQAIVDCEDGADLPRRWDAFNRASRTFGACLLALDKRRRPAVYAK